MAFSLKARINTGILCILASCIALCPLQAAEVRKPVFSYQDAQGQEQTPDFSAHKLTAVHFWATWCVPCLAELPEVDNAQKTYGKKGFHVLALSLDGKMEKVQAFFTEHHIDALAPLLDNHATAFNALNVGGLPTTIFFDSAGKEVARVDGPIHWNDATNKAFIEGRLK